MKNILKKLSVFLSSAILLSSCSTSERARQTTTTDYWDAIMSAYEEEMETIYDTSYDYYDPFADIDDEEKVKSWQEAHGNTTTYSDTDEEIMYIADTSDFLGSNIILKVFNNQKRNYKYYSYNVITQEYGELGIDNFPSNCSENTAILGEYIVNISPGDKTGKKIYSPENDNAIFMTGTYRYDDDNNKNSNYNSYYIDGYILIFKEESSFSGNTYYMGVLDDLGNWVVPLSSELEIFNYVDFNNTDPEYYYMGNGIIEIDRFFYSFLEDKIVFDSWSEYPQYASSDTIFFYNNSILRKQLIYNFETQTKIIDDSIEILDINNDYIYAVYEGGKKILDHSFNILFDLSEYKVAEILSVTNEKIAICAINESDDYYLCLINSDGSFVFEPIKIEYNQIRDKTFISENALVRISDHKTSSVYTFENNEWSYYDNIKGYEPESEIFLKKTEEYYFFEDLTGKEFSPIKQIIQENN